MEEVLDESGIEQAVATLAAAILARLGDKPFFLVGIRSRGDDVARRVAAKLKDAGVDRPLGVLDISLYRDDFAHLHENPKLQSSDIPFPVDGAHLVIVDDVLFTGRTIRAALDAIMDYGRPEKIELAVLIDRGHRELPIAPDYVGATLQTTRRDFVIVELRETDGAERVTLQRRDQA
jgi:pyrimidine operon attenuation protein/uracil phosphoribosyltransferase